MRTNLVMLVACIMVFGQLLTPFMGNARGLSVKPDLTLTSDDIVFSKDKPLKGDSVQINATIHNFGGVNASNVRVRFFDGVPANNKTISSDQILESVPVNGSAVARVNWTDTSVNGTHYIYVVVDPADSIDEDNENNNTANRSILVNLAPTAVLEGALDLEYTWTDLSFNADNSSDEDGNIANCFWDFDDGNTTKGTSVKHSWGDDGVYNITLLVTDNDGGTDTDSKTVTILNRKPVAVAYDQSVDTLDTVTLDSANSWDEDGYIASATWTLHNGTVLSGKKVSTVYKQDGIYSVDLTVTDDDGASNRTDFYITVNNRDPVAVINASSTHINASENITFDAYKSYDLDGYLTNCTWIFTGGAKEYGMTTTHKFGADNGSYQITLAVVDDDGAVASAITSIRVGNLAPVAVGGMDTIVYTYENITFDASRSYDPDGKIVNYTWNYGDGTLSNNAIDLHYYNNNGVYNVTLLITDNDGANAMARLNVTVLDQPPVAFFPDLVANSYMNVSLNGSYCYDNDGYIANFTWDFGSGEKLYGPEISHYWTGKGVFTVTLTVRDDDGSFDSHMFNVTINNALPKGGFIFSPTTPTEQQNVTFNASGSSDLDGYITNYNWNFGDGSYGAGQLVEHAYPANGTYRVTLIITDNDGGTDAATQNITVAKYNAPPVADFSFSPAMPTTTDFIDFDASSSYDPSPGYIRRYEWDWGDGNNSQYSLPRTSHRFFAPGTFNVTLTAVDDASARTSIVKSVSVAPGVNHPPVAVIYALQKTQESGKSMTFDGSASYDPDGSVVNYTWDFGDGSQSYFPLASHVFTLGRSAQRDYMVTLTVTDDQGLSSDANVTVTITPAIPPNIRPKGVLTAAPTTVFTNQLVRLSATGSADPDGTIGDDGYSWSFGDGELGSGVEVFHRYLKPGIYVVLLTVKDNQGATGSATETIYVMNIPPVARPGPDMETLTLDNMLLSGAASSDPDGEIVQYSWDFGDGTQAAGPLVSHTYYHSGVYEVRLTVVDDSGAASSTAINVTARNRAPVATLSGINASAYASDPLNFDGSKSTDSDGRIVNYTWDFGDGVSGEGMLFSHAFLVAGEYIVKLTVTDDSGGSSVANMTVSIIKRPTTPKPQPQPEKKFIPGFEALGALATLVAVALWAGRRKKA